VDFHGLLIEILRLPFDDPEGIIGTFAKTGPESIAVLFRDQSYLPVHNLEGSLGARGHTHRAAIAFFFVDLNDLSFDFHFFSLFFSATEGTEITEKYSLNRNNKFRIKLIV
jgi:hypothetical protein